MTRQDRTKAGFRPDLSERATAAEAEVKRLTGIEAAAKRAADIYEAEIERLRAYIKRLEDYIEPLDGKYICIRADDCFIDDGMIVASDVLEPAAHEQNASGEVK